MYFVYDGGIHTIKCQFTGILMLLFDRYLDLLCHFVWENVVTFCIGALTKTATALLPLLNKQLERVKSCHVMSLSISVFVRPGTHYPHVA
jgi:hypothetical protein